MLVGVTCKHTLFEVKIFIDFRAFSDSIGRSKLSWTALSSASGKIDRLLLGG